MDGFKKLPKMQSFKTGGFVKRKEATVPKVPTEKVAKDTKLTNKKTPTGFVAEDKEAKLDVSTLKKGGRAKKATGTVKKFKKGGEVTNVYEAKKSSGDKDNIKKVKDQKAKKLCGGKSVKKMADGGAAGLTQQATAQAGMQAQQIGAPNPYDVPFNPATPKIDPGLIGAPNPYATDAFPISSPTGFPTQPGPGGLMAAYNQLFGSSTTQPGYPVRDTGYGNTPYPQPGMIPPKQLGNTFGGGNDKFNQRRFDHMQDKMDRFKQRGREIPHGFQERYNQMAALQPKPRILPAQPQVLPANPQVQQPIANTPTAPSWATEAPSWYNQAPSWYNQAPAQATSAAPTPEPALPENVPAVQQPVQTQATGNLATMKRGGKC